MNVRSSNKPPRPLSTLSKTSPLVKPHASPRVRLAAEVGKARASPKPKAPLSSPSPSSSSRSSPHLAASSSSATPSLSTRAFPSSLSPTLSEEQDVVPHATDSMSLLLGLVTSPNVTTTNSTFSSSNPTTPNFTLGSSRLRRKSSPHASRARAAAADAQLSSPRSDTHSYPSSPLMGTLEHREGGYGGLERDTRERAARAAARVGVSPRSGFAMSPSASPSLLPAGLSRDLSALLASPKPHELSHPKTLARSSSLKNRERAEPWPSAKVEDDFTRAYSDMAISQQEAMRDPDAFMHFYPPHKESSKGHDTDAYGRNTLTLSARIKAGMDRYLKGTFDPQSNMILGRGEFSEDLTQDIVTALAFAHDFSAVAIAYMHLYLEEWKDASRKVARLPVPLVRTLPFGRPFIFQGVQLLVCERDGEYVVEAALSPQWEDFEDRISDFRIWIKVVLEETDHFKPHDHALYPIKNFVLGRSHGATLHDIWQTCISFSVWIRELDDLAMMEENSVSGSEAEDLYGQWNRRGAEKLDYPPRKFANRAVYSRPDPYASYGSDDGGISKRSLGSNKTIVKHFNAVRAEKADRADPRASSSSSASTASSSSSSSSSLPPKPARMQRPKDVKLDPRMHFQDGNLSDASNSSSTPVFQPSVTTQMIAPHPELDQARLAPMVMRPKPSFTADLESHHNVHQKRSPLNPVPTVVTSLSRVGSPSDSVPDTLFLLQPSSSLPYHTPFSLRSLLPPFFPFVCVVGPPLTCQLKESGRRWGYQWRQGSEFGGPAHNAHANANSNAPYSNVRPPNSAERPARGSYSSYPGHFYQS